MWSVSCLALTLVACQQETVSALRLRADLERLDAIYRGIAAYAHQNEDKLPGSIAVLMSGDYLPAKTVAFGVSSGFKLDQVLYFPHPSMRLTGVECKVLLAAPLPYIGEDKRQRRVICDCSGFRKSILEEDFQRHIGDK